MLNYSADDETAKNIAVFYARKLNDKLAEEFFAGSRPLATTNEALEVAKVFWQITDLASDDHLNNVTVLDNVDVEFWTHKLFNKVYGYYEKNGFKEQWKIAEAQYG